MKKMILLVFAMAMTLTSFSQGYQPGDEARDFNLKNIDGSMVSLSDYDEAEGFIVIFTCNHCPYAVAYEDRIIELDKKFKKKGYPVIAINPNDVETVPEDSYENMKKRAADKGFTFPYLVDETQEIAKAYGATRTPHVYLLHKESGKNIVKYIGAIDDNHQDADAVEDEYVANAIASLKNGEEVDMKQTKAIGCTIKWKK